MQGLVKVDQHHDARLGGNTGKGDDISRATAYRGAKDGRFPPIRAAMGRAAVREDELEAFTMSAPEGARR